MGRPRLAACWRGPHVGALSFGATSDGVSGVGLVGFVIMKWVDNNIAAGVSVIEAQNIPC